MDHISRTTLKFLKDLQANNDRVWFADNKSRYETAKEEFVEFVRSVQIGVGKFDTAILHLEPEKTVFRIYRDVRFSKNKTPYKTALSARLIPKTNEKGRGAGYYIHVQPGNIVLAGGAYGPTKEWLQAIREEIDYDAEPLRKLIAEKSFKKYFENLKGVKLKTSPKGYDKAHPDIDLLRHKSLVAYHKLSDKAATKPGFNEYCVKVFKAVKPLDDFLNTAMSEE